MILTGKEKALVFLKALGSDAASKIIECLPEDKGQKLEEDLIQFPSPTPEQVGFIYREITRFTLEAKPEPIKIEGEVDQTYVVKTPVETVREYSAQDLLKLLQDEKPQMIAFILENLDLTSRDHYLDLLSPGRRQEIEKCSIESMHFHPELFEKLAKHLVQVKD